MEIKSKEIKIVDIHSVKPNQENPNRHSPEQIDRLVKILKHQGFRSPLTVSNQSGFIVVGHGRLEAAKKAGFTEVPVIFQDFASPQDEYLHLVADNSMHSDWAELDLSLINTKIPEIGPFDIDLLGLKDFQIEVADKYGAEDEVIESPKEARTRLGDLYQLGPHRLLCGDSTQITDVERLMDGERADALFTSPPYNLGNNAKLRGYNGDGDDSAYNEKSDHKSEDEYLDFLVNFTSNALTVCDTAFVNIQILAGNKFVIPDYWIKFKSRLIDIYCWDKEHAQPSAARRVLNSVWEFVFIFGNEDRPTRSMKHGPDFRGTVDNIYRLNPVGKKDPLAKNHGAVFPVQFAEHFVSKFSDNSVLDLFGGSGSTLIACEKTNRKCFMMELDPLYCDVIVDRYLKFSKRNDVLLNGQPYSPVPSI